jgi:WD40 repeat protein
VADWVELHLLSGHKNDVISESFSADGQILATGSIDEVNLWRVSDGSLLHTIGGFTSINTDSIDFSPNGETLVSASSDTFTINLWRISDGNIIYSLEEYSGENAIFSPDGAVIAAGYGPSVRFWQAFDGTSLQKLNLYTRDSNVGKISFSPDGTTLAVGMNKGIELWRVNDGTLLHTFDIETGYGLSVTFSHDGKILGLGSNLGKVGLWHLADGELLQTLIIDEPISIVRALEFSPDNTIIASLAGRNIYFWHIPDGTLLLSLTGHEEDVTSVNFSPDGKIFASGSRDGTVRLWRVSDGTLLKILEKDSEVNHVTFSPNGTILAAGLDDGTIRLWGIAP